MHEDNSATIIGCEKGYSPAMRYLPRTQKIALGFIHEIITDECTEDPTCGTIRIVKAATDIHKGDCFTKELTPIKFQKAQDLIRVRRFTTRKDVI